MTGKEVTKILKGIDCNHITMGKSNAYQFFKIGTRNSVQFGFQSCGYSAKKAKELTRLFFYKKRDTILEEFRITT